LGNTIAQPVKGSLTAGQQVILYLNIFNRLSNGQRFAKVADGGFVGVARQRFVSGSL